MVQVQVVQYWCPNDMYVLEYCTVLDYLYKYSCREYVVVFVVGVCLFGTVGELTVRSSTVLLHLLTAA